WTKGRQRLVQVKDGKVRYFVNKEQCRCAILRNGTLQIQRLEKEDSGSYMVTVYQQDGKLKAEENIMFFVQGEKSLRCACLFPSFSDPVPQPILSGDCVNKSVSVKCEVKH
ncbi:CD2 protein, partial [Sterrhoptilus dennistouni]|nr:CD2 protein [Sterrhoptilus dennistouni]